MRSGVITLNAEGVVTKVNNAADTFLRRPESLKNLVGQDIRELFTDRNHWIAKDVEEVLTTGETREGLDTPIVLPVGEQDSELTEDAAINLSTLPLNNAKEERIGCLLLIEDITSEKRLRSTMSRYMTKEIADKLLDGGEEALGGNVQHASVLFSDIRGFTAFAERSGPQDTVRMLNDYFTVMVDLVMAHNGILDKYMGDGMMAVFGAPFPGEEDADNAMTSALEMFAALEDFNKHRIHTEREPIDIRIGLNTDQVVSGNIGSIKRMDYTVIGDGVNLAARLESASKAYGTRLLVSQFSVDHFKNDYLLRKVDLLRVQGKENPVEIYEGLDSHINGAISDKPGLIQAFQEGLENYRSRNWTRAMEIFSSALEIYPEDGVAKVYQGRCERFMETPPGNDWDGVWTMTHK